MNRMKLVSRSAAAIGIAAAFAMAPGFARASSLTIDPTIFFSPSGTPYLATADPITGRAWVSPNIASGDTYDDISALCPGGACTGALSGLTWASDGQVNTFWKDIGIPINTVLGLPATTESYSSIGEGVLSDLIFFLGPTYTSSSLVLGTGFKSYYLGGITNDPTVFGVPNTSYMFHADSYIASFRSPHTDNESAFTYGAGNGYLEDPATKGWFYFTPSSGGSTPVPEPGSLGMLGLGMGLLGLGFAWDKRRRNKHEQEATGMPMNGGSFA